MNTTAATATATATDSNVPAPIVTLLERTGVAAKKLATTINAEVNVAIKATRAVDSYQGTVLAVLKDCPDNSVFHVLFGHGKGTKAVKSAILEQVYALLPIRAIDPKVSPTKLLEAMEEERVNKLRRESVRVGLLKVKALWDEESQTCLAKEGESVGAAVARLAKEKMLAVEKATANQGIQPPAPPAPPAPRAPHHNEKDAPKDPPKSAEILKKELDTAKAELALEKAKQKTLDGAPALGKLHIPMDCTIGTLAEGLLGYFNQNPGAIARFKVNPKGAELLALLTK